MKRRRLLFMISMNIVVFLSLLVIADLFLGRWINFPIIDEYNWGCSSKRLHHNYCKNIVFDRVMDYKDGGHVIRNYIGDSALRVESEGDTVITEDYDVVNIGDSFLQAEEIPYNKTLSFHMQQMTGKRVLQVGYSSWSVIQFYRWLQDHELKKGAIVNLFTMVNDFTPSYSKSNISYHENIVDGEFQDVQESHGVATKKSGWKSFMVSHSFIYSKLKDILHSTSPTKVDKYVEFNKLFADLQTDCDLLRTQKNASPLTFDYMTYSFDAKCWDKKHIEATDSVISDMELLKKELENMGVKANFFLIPPGWSFQNENIFGKNHPLYKISKNSVIGIQGLVKYIGEYSSIKVIDLQSVITTLKARNYSQWYLPVDGHWTEHAHYAIGSWLASNPDFHGKYNLTRTK